MRRTPNSLSCSVGTTRECRRLESLVAGLAMLRPDASRAIQTMLTVEAERKQMKLNIRRQLSQLTPEHGLQHAPPTGNAMAAS